MKKYITFILSILLASSLHADFKLMGGLNLSKYTVSPEEGDMKWDYKKGFLAGIGFERALTENMLLEFDFLFFQKGSKVKSSNLPDFRLKYNLNTLSIPVLLGIKFLNGTSPYVLGGVEFSSITSHTVKSGGKEAVDLKENTKSIDLGLVFGCGFEVKIQEHLFFLIEARYHLGRNNIISNPIEGESMKTHAILIVVGVKS